MKQSSFLTAVALVFSLALPNWAQTPINAPAGWKTQTRNGGTKTFSPPDLRPGEVYSVTIYDAVPSSGKTLEGFLRSFAGTVGTKVGQLAGPLQIKVTEGRGVSGYGAYGGPNGTALLVMFVGISLDGGAGISVSRTLFSQTELLERYQDANKTLASAMGKRAVAEVATSQKQSDAPEALLKVMKPGGALVPGVYAGTQTTFGPFGSRRSVQMRVYLYANGEYRITDANDQDFNINGPVVGKIKYNRERGLLDLGFLLSFKNDNLRPGQTFCYYGLDFEGKPVIYAHDETPTVNTSLIRVGPPTGRLSKSAEEAPAKAIEAKRNRIQSTVAPGKGVRNDQIAALMHEYHEASIAQSSVSIYGEFMMGGINIQITDRAYLLLKDGTVYEDLLVAPDQLDIAASRRKEPERWGLWKWEDGHYQISMGGKPYKALDGKKAIAGTPQSRLSGRYITASPSRGDISSVWGATFTQAGRFVKDPLPKREDDSAVFTLSKGKGSAVNSKTDREGTYSINGYALTLRYDSGRVARMPFFFIDSAHTGLWFEGNRMVRPDAKIQ